MSEQLYECNKVDLDFFKNAPMLVISEATIPCSPQTLFKCFEDAVAWTEWAPPIKKVTWTSPQPFNVGTTRIVDLAGGMLGDEEFLLWEMPQRMAFRFNRCNQKYLKAFGEHYEVTDLGNNRCHLVWTVGMEQSGFMGLMSPLITPVLGWAMQRLLNGLPKYIEREGHRWSTLSSDAA